MDRWIHPKQWMPMLAMYLNIKNTKTQKQQSQNRM